MKVVVDTNVLLVSLSKNSKFRPIFDALIACEYELGVSTSIMLEYEEVFTKKNGSNHTAFIMKILEKLENLIFQEIHFNWHLIKSDPDDNIFSDCAVAFNADYHIIHDADFNVLRKIDFPKIQVISATEFLEILKQSDPT